MSMQNIETLTRDFADARSGLAARVQAYQDEVEKIKRRLLPGIKRAVETAATTRDRLRNEIERQPELFVRPKSVILHGVRVGYQKAKGVIEWDDEEKVVALIHKHFPDQTELLLKTVERPLKTALAQLPAADLKRLGVTVTDSGDEVLIKPVDGAVDKLVDALLKDTSAELEKAA